MKPKEKAEELVYKMSLATDESGYINTNVHRHKQCALIAVDEIIDVAIGNTWKAWEKKKKNIGKKLNKK